MKFIETTESAWSAEQLAAAEREIENQKREWEQNRLAALKEEEERRHRELEEESELLTFSREDAANQVSSKSKRLSVRSQLSKNFNKRRKIIKTKIASSPSDINVKEKKFQKKNNNKPKKEPDEEKVVEKEPTPPIITTNSQDSEESQPIIDESSRLSEEIHENNLESDESEDSAKINFENKTTVNKLDHNSPRTRSRGTVAINLWTLDVSPILPGEKPIRKLHRAENADRDEENSSSESEVRSDEENDEINMEQQNKFQTNHFDKKCTVALYDILLDDEYVFPKVVCYAKKVFDKPLEMIRNHPDDNKSENNLSDNEEKIVSEKNSNDTEKCGDTNTRVENQKSSTPETPTSTSVQSSTSKTIFHLLNHKEKSIQSKLLTESMLKEKYVREEIKKSLNVEANFDAKFHIPKKSSAATDQSKVTHESADDKLQLSDVSDGEFSINDNSNSDSKLSSNISFKNPPSQDTSNNRLFVTTSSYQETFKTYVKSHHRPPHSPNTLTNISGSSNVPCIQNTQPSSSNTLVSSEHGLLNSSNVSNSSNVHQNSFNTSLTNFNASMNSSSSSLNNSDSFTNNSNLHNQSSSSSSNVPRMPQKPSNQRQYSNHRFRDFNRKNRKFRKKNYSLDNWLNKSKDARNRKGSESNCRDSEVSHRDTKNNSFS